jgi:hypothetical protein
MRYLVGFVFVLAALVASPLSAGAQTGQEGTDSEPNLQEPAPSSEPAPEEPALQLQLDKSGVEVVPSPPRTPDGYTLEEMDVRVRRAKIGVGVSGLGLVAGAVMGLAVLGASMCPFTIPGDTTCPPSWVNPVGNAGLVLGVGGLAGIIASGILLRKRKRDRDSLRGPHYRTPRSLEPTSPDDLRTTGDHTESNGTWHNRDSCSERRGGV